MSGNRPCLRVCTAASCRSRGGETLRQSCAELMATAALQVKGVGCLGPCSDGPLLALDVGSSGHLFGLGVLANGADIHNGNTPGALEAS